MTRLRELLTLVKQHPKRAFYFLEGHFFWMLFRKSILKNLKAAIGYVEKAQTPVKIADYQATYQMTYLEAVAMNRYMNKYDTCKPCFYAGSCIHCGCNTNAIFMSSLKCSSNDGTGENIDPHLAHI